MQHGFKSHLDDFQSGCVLCFSSCELLPRFARSGDVVGWKGASHGHVAIYIGESGMTYLDVPGSPSLIGFG